MVDDPAIVHPTLHQTVQPPEPFGDRPAPMARTIRGASCDRMGMVATVSTIVMADVPGTVGAVLSGVTVLGTMATTMGMCMS
jgi:hypothetical protein